jgi:LAS superfamily LD-carboxypeptidase LdcB
MKRPFTRFLKKRYVAVVVCMLLLLCAVFVAYRLIQVRNENRDLKATVAALRGSIRELEGNLSLSAYERDRLTSVLDETQQDAQELAMQTESLEGKVDEFEKLNTLDPELLKKYSKVYFLNEHYIPSSLITIDQKYMSGQKVMQFHADAWPYLKDMLDDSTDDGLSLRVASAYRSFERQAALKSAYTVTYGAGANRFSADQGYSEHQLATTLDFTTAKTGNLSSSFETTPEFKWLNENAHRYGFVLSYPKGNQYYIYEPWHWRFVGVALATDLYETKTRLYDMDQRTIDTYLLHLFD